MLYNLVGTRFSNFLVITLCRYSLRNKKIQKMLRYLYIFINFIVYQYKYLKKYLVKLVSNINRLKLKIVCERENLRFVSFKLNNNALS